ncbi:uncharacterized protein [Primulina eburnea]|uniref:uncharacterized protein isoform X1 n=1 Tax=Primulina eburnea TaxID=1245227 RepID=UPI003C6C0775
MEPKTPKDLPRARSVYMQEKETSTGDNDVPEFVRVVGGKQRYAKLGEVLWHESIETGESREGQSIHMVGKNASDETGSRINENKAIFHTAQQAEITRIIDDISLSQLVKPKSVKEDNILISDDGKIKDPFLALKLEREEIYGKRK